MEQRKGMTTEAGDTRSLQGPGTYCIFGRLSGANESIRANRTNRFIGAKLKQQETELCAMACRGIGKAIGPVGIEIVWTEPNNRRDVDNVRYGAKAILDGLVKAGKLDGDGKKNVRWIKDTFTEADAEHPMIRVTVWPLDHTSPGF